MDSTDQVRPSPDEVWRIFLWMEGGQEEAKPYVVYRRVLLIRELTRLACEYDSAASDDWATKRGVLQEVVLTLLAEVSSEQRAHRMLSEVLEAIKFAQHDRKHPLFHAEARSSLEHLRSQGRIEGISAAVLEWGVDELRANEQALAAQIAQVLARAGFSRKKWGTASRARYSTSAIIKWRKRYREGGQPAQRYFELWLGQLRKGWLQVREGSLRHEMPTIEEQLRVVEEIARGWSRPDDSDNMFGE